MGDDPARRLDGLRAALAGTAADLEGTLRRAVARLRVQIRDDLHETGADATTYIAHLERSLRARVFMSSPEATKELRSRANAAIEAQLRETALHMIDLPPFSYLLFTAHHNILHAVRSHTLGGKFLGDRPIRDF